MSAPVIWVVGPMLAAFMLFLIRRWTRITTLIGIAFSLVLALVAWKVPVARLITISRWSFKINDTLPVLGRRFVLADTARPTLTIIYLAAAIWFLGAYPSKANRMFIPIGLGLVALLTATLAVDPFLYAALLIEVAVLLCVPLLAPPGKKALRGVVRFITFQTLGVPFILFSGWLLTGLETAPSDSILAGRAAVLLGLGFTFLLALFPFHTWLPMLAEESHPYAAAFVFFTLPGIVSLFGLNFLNQFSWLRDSTGLYNLLLAAGAIMVATGGIWAAFQKNLGRIMGFAVMVEIGLSLLAIGSGQPGQGSPANSALLAMFNALFLSRGLALGLWALALSAIRERIPDLRFRSAQGLARQMPLASAGVILAHFSIAGFPLLAGFPVRLALIEKLAQITPGIALVVILGFAGLFASGLRSLAVLVTGADEQPWKITENRLLQLFLITAICVLFVTGLFPHL